MSAEMQDFNRLIHPVVKLVHGGGLSYVLDLALDILQEFLDDGLFLKIVDLLNDLVSMNVQHGLWVKEQEGRWEIFALVFLALVAFEILHEHLAQRIAVDAQFKGGQDAHVKWVESEAVVKGGRQYLWDFPFNFIL